MRPPFMRQVSTTSVDVGYGLVARRAESDTDSAISVSMDLAEVEKQSFLPLRSSSPEQAWNSGSRPYRSTTSAKKALLFLLPSFISQRFQNTSAVHQPHQGIAALDGLRGLAALCVLNEHFSQNFDTSFLNGYGVDNQRKIVQWPVVRVLWSGLSMVAIFFVISGYVLSYKALQQIHNSNSTYAHRSLTSSTLRRIFRLYVPTITAVMICGLSSWFGLFEQGRAVYMYNNNAWKLREVPPPRFDNFYEQMRDTTQHAFRLLNTWRMSEGNLNAGDYDQHTWTIPIEYRNSMVLFLFLLAISTLRTVFRMPAQVGIIVFTVLTGNKNMVLFLSGMLLADLDLTRKLRSHFLAFASTPHQRPSILLALVSPTSWLYPLVFLVGLFLCSIPVNGAQNDLIYKHIYSIIPKSLEHPTEWVRVPGAIMIVWAAANSAHLKRLFINKVTTYLGKISFALYLVHGSVIRAVLYASIPKIYSMTGLETKDGQTTGQLIGAWVLGAMIVLPVTLWVADLFWRVIDLPCIRFAKWAELRLSESGGEGTPCTTPKRWT